MRLRLRLRLWLHLWLRPPIAVNTYFYISNPSKLSAQDSLIPTFFVSIGFHIFSYDNSYLKLWLVYWHRFSLVLHPRLLSNLFLRTAFTKFWFLIGFFGLLPLCLLVGFTHSLKWKTKFYAYLSLDCLSYALFRQISPNCYLVSQLLLSLTCVSLPNRDQFSYCLRAVSYTHLDVYKRQGWEWHPVKRLRCRWVISVHQYVVVVVLHLRLCPSCAKYINHIVKTSEWNYFINYPNYFIRELQFFSLSWQYTSLYYLIVVFEQHIIKNMSFRIKI